MRRIPSSKVIRTRPKGIPHDVATVALGIEDGTITFADVDLRNRKQLHTWSLAGLLVLAKMLPQPHPAALPLAQATR